MIRKYFPLDKNYLLEQAQYQQEKEQIRWLIDYCKTYYLRTQNPLGIMDDTALAISRHETEYDKRFSQLYRDMGGIYRYRYGDNQLEFLFDGTDHFTKYQTDWNRAFRAWVTQLSQSMYFVRTCLEIAVFSDAERQLELAENRLKSYIEKEFNVRLYHYRGIRESA